MIKDYIKRLFNGTWLLVTGLVEGVTIALDSLSDADFPRSLYPIVLGVSLVAGGYSAYVAKVKECEDEERRLRKEVEALQRRLNDHENRKPDLRIWMLRDDIPERELEVSLKLRPPRPSVPELVGEERTRQLGRLEEYKSQLQASPSLGLEWGPQGLFLAGANPRFPQDLEEYLGDFAAYLDKRYRHSIRGDRFERLTPLIENIGSSAASDIEIEFVLSAPIRPATSEEVIWYELNKKSPPSPPKEPSLQDTRVQDLLERMPDLSWQDLSHPLPPGTPSNAEGPEYREVGGDWLITYKVHRLIQNRREDGLESLDVWLGEIEKSGIYRLRASIYCAELPEPNQEIISLHVKVGS
jgi:hypothetical protein